MIIYMYTFYLSQRGPANTVEEYLEVITELLAYSEFVNDYNIVYDMAKDIKKSKNANKEM